MYVFVWRNKWIVIYKKKLWYHAFFALHLYFFWNFALKNDFFQIITYSLTEQEKPRHFIINGSTPHQGRLIIQYEWRLLYKYTSIYQFTLSKSKYHQHKYEAARAYYTNNKSKQIKIQHILRIFICTIQFILKIIPKFTKYLMWNGEIFHFSKPLSEIYLYNF